MTPIPKVLDNDTLSVWHNKCITLQQRVLQNAQRTSRQNLNKTNSFDHMFYSDLLMMTSIKAISRVNGDKYTLQDITTGKNHEVHISRLQPFIYDDKKYDS